MVKSRRFRNPITKCFKKTAKKPKKTISWNYAVKSDDVSKPELQYPKCLTSAAKNQRRQYPGLCCKRR